MLGRRQNTVAFRQRQQVNQNQENASVAPGKATFGKPVLGKPSTGLTSGIQTRARAALGDRSNTYHVDNVQANRGNPPAAKKEPAAECMDAQQSVAGAIVTKARRLAKTVTAASRPKPQNKPEEVVVPHQTTAAGEDMEVDEPTVTEEDMLIEAEAEDLSLPLCERRFDGRQTEREQIRAHVLNIFGGGIWEPGPTSIDRVTNPDLADCANTQMVADYVYDIFDYLQDLELQRMPLKQDFLNHCTQITSRMRYVLVDWMVQIHSRFEMLPETLYLGIGMMDRFLSTPQGSEINKDNLQLLGVVAMMVAAKFEEMYPPEVTDFTYVTGNAYTATQLREFEWTLLSNIGFFCTVPTPITFLRRFSRLIQATGEMHSAAKYLLELSSSEYSLCYYPGCLRASAAICLSIALIKYGSCSKPDNRVDLSTLIAEAWLPNLQFSAAYDIKDIIPVARKMASVVGRQSTPSKYRSIHKKYVATEVHSVAMRPEFKSALLIGFAEDCV